MTKTRGELRNAGAEFHVAKNRLLKLASQGTDSASMQDQFVGPCALAIAKGDMVKCANALVNLSKEYDKLKIKAGQISGKVLSGDGIRRLAELPSREVLLSQVLSAMQAVPTSFVRVLQGVLVKFLHALKAIETKKTGDITK
jgi:large subunit ribosomal protein L10